MLQKPIFKEVACAQVLLMIANKIMIWCRTIRSLLHVIKVSLVTPMVTLLLPGKFSAATWTHTISKQFESLNVQLSEH